jgi:hypothetical protein
MTHQEIIHQEITHQESTHQESTHQESTHQEITHQEITTNKKNVILSEASRSLIAGGAVEGPAVGSCHHNPLSSRSVSCELTPLFST